MPNHRKQEQVCYHCGSHIPSGAAYAVSFPRANGSVSRDFCSRRCYNRFEEREASEGALPITTTTNA